MKIIRGIAVYSVWRQGSSMRRLHVNYCKKYSDLRQCNNLMIIMMECQPIALRQNDAIEV